MVAILERKIMAFYESAWRDLKTCGKTLAQFFERLQSNVDYLKGNLVQGGLVRRLPFGNRTDRVNGGMFTRCIYRRIEGTFSDIVLDDTYDYRDRFLELRGFVSFDSVVATNGVPTSKQSRLRIPGQLDDNLIGRYRTIYDDGTHPIMTRNVGPIKTSNLIDMTTAYNPWADTPGVPPTNYTPDAESRIFNVFYTSGGLLEAPRIFDLFNNEVELPFCRIRCEDAHTMGVETYQDNGEWKRRPKAGPGAWVFLYARQSDGALMTTLLNHTDVVENINDLNVNPDPDPNLVAMNLNLVVTA
ncbi:MAG: hypothetical protein D6816_10075, partial [Bacteroidetes bacterium]